MLSCDTFVQASPARQGGAKPFEPLWVTYPDFQDKLSNTWCSGTFRSGTNIYEQMVEVGHVLHNWSATVLGDLPRKIKETRAHLDSLRQQHQFDPHQEVTLLHRLEALLDYEEEYWRQQSRVDWLQLGVIVTQPIFIIRLVKGGLGTALRNLSCLMVRLLLR